MDGQTRVALRNAWLVCGILSSLLYAGMTVLVPTQWPGYDSTSQVVSELSAVGAPTRSLWMALGFLYTLLVTAFGWGVWQAAEDDRRLQVTGILIVTYGALGLVWPFAPMHLHEDLAAGGGTFTDTLHIILGLTTQLIYLLALGFAASALGRALRLYSAVTFVALLSFGVMMGREAPGVAANQPTPLIGVWERLDIGVFLLWMIVLATKLLTRGRLGTAKVPHRVARPGDGPMVLGHS